MAKTKAAVPRVPPRESTRGKTTMTKPKPPTKISSPALSTSLRLQVTDMPGGVCVRLSDARAAILYVGLSEILAWPALGGNMSVLQDN